MQRDSEPLPEKTYDNQMTSKKFVRLEPSGNTELTYAEVAAKREKLTNSMDKQVGGNHYSKMAIQPIDYIVKNDIPYMEANAIKYITRHRSKNGAQDIEKAIHYLEMILKGYR